MSIAPAKKTIDVFWALHPKANWLKKKKKDNKSKVQDVMNKPVVTKVLQALYL